MQSLNGNKWNLFWSICWTEFIKIIVDTLLFVMMFLHVNWCKWIPSVHTQVTLKVSQAHFESWETRNWKFWTHLTTELQKTGFLLFSMIILLSLSDELGFVVLRSTFCFCLNKIVKTSYVMFSIRYSDLCEAFGILQNSQVVSRGPW